MTLRKSRWQRLRTACRIDPRGWRGAGLGLARSGWIVLTISFLMLVFPDFTTERALGSAVLVTITLLVALGGLVVTGLLRRLTPGFWWGFWLLLAAMLLLTGLTNIAVQGLVATVVWVLLGAGLSGGGLALLRTRGWRWLTGFAVASGLFLLATMATLSVLSGWRDVVEKRPSITTPTTDLPDPGVPGSFSVSMLTYGAGDDRYRPEFGHEASLKSRTVDGSKFIEGWEGYAGWARTRYWGFDATALPINGRVWMPEGEGPLPVVLIVHGNHDMEDFSDGGYGYLGEHFASRGMITISVDENFLNSSYADLLSGVEGGLQSENDARGWLLLEHLRQLAEWNIVEGNPFHHRLDLERVALIGHSRGGEAVAEAALFNRLPVYPDDARQKFDYDFGIRSLIAIAPADGQYDPRDRVTRLGDMNYLVVHGSLDGDVQSFMGASQYARVGFSACLDCYKSSVYVMGANHGQFNTDWGRADLAWPGRMILNLVPILDGALQRKVATRLFTAFLEDTLLGNQQYREVFSLAPRAVPWLDEPVELVTDFQSGRDLVVADYEEDADLATGSMPGVHIMTNDLTLWRETEVNLKWAPRNSAAVLVGWDRATDREVPAYSITFDLLPAAPGAIALSLAMAQESPMQDEEAEWETPETLDFSVVLVDYAGRRASVPLSTLGMLRAPVEAQTRKHAWLDDIDRSEPVFQRYTLASTLFKDVDVSAIAAMSLEFDRNKAGALFIDDVSLLPAIAQDDLDAIDEAVVEGQEVMRVPSEADRPSGPLPPGDGHSTD